MRNAVGAQVIADRRAAQVRGTQTLVDQMGWMIRRPAIVAVEVGWRWLFGVPFLLACRAGLQRVFAQLSPEAAGLRNIDAQNPWIAAGQLSRALAKYEPLIAHELRWLVPIAVLAWIVISSIGRNLALKQMDARVRLRPLAMMVLQTAWLALFGGVCWGWFRAVSWAAAAHFPAGARAGSDRPFHLAYLSFAGVFHGVGAVGMDCVCCAGADAVGRPLRGFGSWNDDEAGKDLHVRAVRDRHGDGHREPGADGAGDGAIGRAAAFQRSAWRRCTARGVGRGCGVLPGGARLLSAGAAEVLCRVLEDFSRRTALMLDTAAVGSRWYSLSSHSGEGHRNAKASNSSGYALMCVSAGVLLGQDATPQIEPVTPWSDEQLTVEQLEHVLAVLHKESDKDLARELAGLHLTAAPDRSAARTTQLRNCQARKQGKHYWLWRTNLPFSTCLRPTCSIFRHPIALRRGGSSRKQPNLLPPASRGCRTSRLRAPRRAFRMQT